MRGSMEVGWASGGTLRGRRNSIRTGIIYESAWIWDGVPGSVIANEALHIFIRLELLERET